MVLTKKCLKVRKKKNQKSVKQLSFYKTLTGHIKMKLMVYSFFKINYQATKTRMA